MLIGSQFKLSQINSDFTVKVNNTPLERVIKHKSLGVQIDESLNWRPHIHTISKKISAGIAILRRVSHFIPFDTRVNMYNALVMPYFNYCGAVWGNINKGLADKLQKLQNRAARILTFSNYDVRILKIFIAKGGTIFICNYLGGNGYCTPHFSENPRPPLGRNKRSSLRSRFGHFTTNDKQRFAVSGFTFDLSAHIWDLKFAGGSSRLPCLFSFTHLLLF